MERAPDKTWPDLQSDRQYPITIRAVTGYGAASAVPPLVKQAMLMIVAHWYRNRESVVTGSISKEIENGVRAILESEGYGSY